MANPAMKIPELRFGFERTIEITGLVAVAFVISGILGSFFVAPPLPPQPLASEVTWTTILLTLKNALWHICMFLLAMALASRSLNALWTAPQKPVLMILCTAAGLVLGLFVSIPLYNWISLQVLGSVPQKFNAENLLAAGLVPFLVADFTMSLLVAPIVEEFAARGVLAERLNGLPRWHVAIWCVTFFCVVHFLGSGLMKIAAVLPMSIFFTALRMGLGSWKYAIAAHAGANLASLLLFYQFL
jgi:membrane protease YdiL (CAAX protease family)